jgi:hypothetical protein
MRFFLIFSLILTATIASHAQCSLAVDEIDEFDSTRLIVAHPVSFGYFIPSKFETADGPKLVREGQLLFAYSENDTINSFFMTLAIPEYTFEPIEKDFNVFLKLSDGGVFRMYNVPDQGVFDDKTNMRIYQHTCVVPLDLFYRLTFSTIEKIRIVYRNQKRTIDVSPKQQEEIRKAVQCVGKATGIYPIKP